MTLPPPRILFSTSESLPVPLWRGNMTETFLSSGKFLWISLEVIVFYGVDISRVGLRLENHGGSCHTPNSELPPPETPAYLSNHPVLKHFLSVFHYLNQDGAEVHILSGALLSSSYLIVCMFFSHICSASHPPPFREGTSRR